MENMAVVLDLVQLQLTEVVLLLGIEYDAILINEGVGGYAPQ